MKPWSQVCGQKFVKGAKNPLQRDFAIFELILVKITPCKTLQKYLYCRIRLIRHRLICQFA